MSHIYKYFSSVVVNMKWEIVPDVVFGPAVCSLSPLCKNCFEVIYLKAAKGIVSTFFFLILS